MNKSGYDISYRVMTAIAVIIPVVAIRASDQTTSRDSVVILQ